MTASIQSLLYDHECVVIPQFGGFVTNYKAAFVHPKKQSIHPPSKQLAFNVNLKSNDGLLANYISQSDNVSYELALDFVKTTVKEYSKTLENDKRLELEGLGILSKNIQGGIEFTPSNTTNFLRNSFGLNPVFLPSLSELLGEEQEMNETIKATSISKETPVVQLVNKTEKETQVISIEQKKRRKNLVAAAFFLPLMFLGGMTLQKKQPQLASFFGGMFKSPLSISADYTPRFQDEKVVFNYDFQGNTIDIIAEQNPELQSIYYSFEKGEISPKGVKILLDSKTSTSTPNQIKPKPTTGITPKTTSSSTSKLGLYFTVAGAFGEKSNAEKLVRRLKAKGYDATIFAKRGNLHMVCYGSYTNKAAASNALNQIKQTENADAWLKKH